MLQYYVLGGELNQHTVQVQVKAILFRNTVEAFLFLFLLDGKS